MEPQQTYKSKDLCVYALRWLANTAILILFGHFLYTFAIMENGSKVPFAGDTATYFDSLFSFRQDGEGMVWFSYWALKGLWLKFLVVWRFARLCALVDGVCPPENMNRCMSNNYTVKGFWRAWHRSFNRWLVRYIYVPIGGSRQKSVLRRVVSVLTVFMFVALWHEPKVFWKDWDMVRVMVWGLLMAAFMVPELLVERVCSLPSVQQRLKERPLLARHLTACGGAVCIEMLMLANLIGYTYGLYGAGALLSTLRHPGMPTFLAAYMVWLFSGVQIMLVIRQREAGKLAAKCF